MRPRRLLLVLAYLAFISLGLPDTVLGVAWPTIRTRFGLTQAAMGILLMVGTIGYVASGLVAGRLVRRLGVGGLLAGSCALVALALVGFASAPTWIVFVPLAAVHGLGSGAIDATLNGYAARHFPIRHLNWLHACWSMGTTLGPLVMTAALSRTGSFRPGYAALAVALVAMGLAFLMTRRSWEDGGESVGTALTGKVPAPAASSAWGVLQSGRVWLQITLFFVYTGLEGSAGQWCFTIMREQRGLGLEAAGAWTAAFWASLLIGRVAVGFVVDAIGPDRLLRICTATALLGALAFAGDAGLAGRVGLLFLGMSLAPMYPTLMARTPARLGTGMTAHAVGFQVSSATLGAAVLPGTIGFLAARAGLGVVAPTLVGIGVVFLALHEGLLRTTRNG